MFNPQKVLSIVSQKEASDFIFEKQAVEAQARAEKAARDERQATLKLLRQKKQDIRESKEIERLRKEFEPKDELEEFKIKAKGILKKTGDRLTGQLITGRSGGISISRSNAAIARSQAFNERFRRR